MKRNTLVDIMYSAFWGNYYMTKERMRSLSSLARRTENSRMREIETCTLREFTAVCVSDPISFYRSSMGVVS